MLPGDKRVVHLFNTYRNWLTTEGRRCLPEAREMTVEMIDTREKGILCKLLYIPPSMDYNTYAPVVKAFHPECRVQVETNTDENTEIIRVLVPYSALPPSPSYDAETPFPLSIGGGSSSSGGFLLRLLDNPRFVIGLTIVVALSASYTTDIGSWKALVGLFR